MDTATKVGRARAWRNADLAAKPAPDEYVECAHAMARVTGRISGAVAEEVGIPSDHVEDWQSPARLRRRRSPPLLLAQMMDVALEIKGPAHRKDVFAALDWLELRFGRVAVDLPTAKSNTAVDRLRGVALALAEIAEFLKAAENQTPEGRLRATQELGDAIYSLQQLMPPEAPPTGGDNVTSFAPRR